MIFAVPTFIDFHQYGNPALTNQGDMDAMTAPPG